MTIIGGFIVVFAMLALAPFFWSGARRRSWFWILDVVVGILILLLVAPGIGFSLTHPADTQGFIPTVFALLGAGLAIAGGIRAFLDVRRGSPSWTRAGRAGQVLTALSALAVGALATSALAGNASAGAVAWPRRRP